MTLDASLWERGLTSELCANFLLEGSVLLKDPNMFHDVGGVVVSGPTNQRTPNTKQCPRRAAGSHLIRESQNPDAVVQPLDLTAWERFIHQLQPLVGQCGALLQSMPLFLQASAVDAATSLSDFTRDSRCSFVARRI